MRIFLCSNYTLSTCYSGSIYIKKRLLRSCDCKWSPCWSSTIFQIGILLPSGQPNPKVHKFWVFKFFKKTVLITYWISVGVLPKNCLHIIACFYMLSVYCCTYQLMALISILPYAVAATWFETALLFFHVGVKLYPKT